MHLFFFVLFSSGAPTLSRNTSASLLQFDDGKYWVFDCGEGFQKELLKYQNITNKDIEAIFITHLHGDHLYGLFGLLCSLSLLARSPDRSIDLIGPKGLRHILEVMGPITDMCINFTINLVELV